MISIYSPVPSRLIIGLMISLMLFSMSLEAKEINQDTNEQQAVENYLMGKFNPATHKAFVKIPKRFANRSGYYLRKEAFDAYTKMYDAARKDGVNLVIRSATRNFNYQKSIWERKWRAQKKSRSPKSKALNILSLSSMPGTSRHHWGTEIDLNAFNNTWFESGKGLKLFNWLNENAVKYGFNRPYTKKDAQRPSGYNEEKWHWSYTPLSIPMVRDAKLALKDKKITGFLGSNTAQQIGVVKNYVLGIDKCCL